MERPTMTTILFVGTASEYRGLNIWYGKAHYDDDQGCFGFSSPELLDEMLADCHRPEDLLGEEGCSGS